MATPQLPLPLTTTRKPTKPTTLPPSEALPLCAPLDTYPISRFSCWPSAANNFNSLSLMCCQLFLMGPLRAWSGGRGRHLPTYWNILFAFCLFLWARVVANSQLIYDPLWSQQILFRPHTIFIYILFLFLFSLYFIFIFTASFFHVCRWTCKLYFDVGAQYVCKSRILAPNAFIKC